MGIAPQLMMEAHAKKTGARCAKVSFWVPEKKDLQPVGPRPAPVAGHGVPAQTQVPGDGAFRFAQAEPAEHFAHVGHLTPPSSHCDYLRVWVPGEQSRRLTRNARDTGRPSRVAQYGCPLWLSLGDPGWLSFPDPGGSV